jgi:hypothetical protein
MTIHSIRSPTAPSKQKTPHGLAIKPSKFFLFFFLSRIVVCHPHAALTAGFRAVPSASSVDYTLGFLWRVVSRGKKVEREARRERRREGRSLV